MKDAFIFTLDKDIIFSAQHFSQVASRFALFIIYFWFGYLKVVGLSPANPLVDALLHQTMPWMGFSIFVVLFGAYEMLIGALFLFPKTNRIVMPLLLIHLITTAGPLVLLPNIVWQGWLVPTMEGQYIIKNLAIIALAIGLVAQMRPMHPPKPAKKTREKK